MSIFSTPPLSEYGVRSLDGVTPANSPENRRMAARFILIFSESAAALGTVAGIASVVSGDRYTDHPLGIVIIALAIGIAGFVEAWLVVRWLPIWLVHVVVATAVICIVSGGLIVGDRSSFLLVTLASAIVLAAVALAATVPVIIVSALGFGGAYATLLLVQPHPAPVAEIWTVIGSGLVVARLVSWLVALAVERSRKDREAREQLEVVSDRQTAFLGNMSHELRTPLNAIIGFSELLADGAAGEMNERQREYVEDVRGSGQHLLALIDDVLDLAKVEEGRTDLDLRPVDVTALLTASATLFREQAGRHGIAIEVASAHGIPTVEADERKLRQVVFNLLSNAVRFTPDHGRVEIGVRSRPGGVAIWVSDTGPGIARDQQDRIFEEYHQGAPSEGARQPGTGLGLALVRKFVQLHGGRIGVDSRLGAGATFTVELPEVAAAVEDREVNVAPLATRWRDHFAVRSIEGDTAPDSQENRKRVAELIMGVVVSGIVVLYGAEFLFMPVTDDPRYRPMGVLLVGGMGLLAAALFKFNAHRIPLGAAHPIAFASTIGVSVASYFAGAAHPEVAFGYAAFGIASYAVFRLGGAILQSALIGVCYAVLLHVQPGNFNPLGRWLIVVPGTMVASLAVLWLVGEMARYSESERRARAQLEIVSRHKSEFLANMSHELRTPLNAIIGFSEVLRDELFGPLTPRQAEYVDDILDAGRHLLAVINDILDLAKLEAGRMPTQVRDLSLAPLLEAVARRRELDVSVPAGARVVGDEAQVLQLLDNLVTASPGAERLDVDVDNGFVRVRIERDGPPLFVDDERAFEEFHRGERVGGTGLELPLARALATLHQGRVEVADARQLAVVLPRAE